MSLRAFFADRRFQQAEGQPGELGELRAELVFDPEERVELFQCRAQRGRDACEIGRTFVELEQRALDLRSDTFEHDAHAAAVEPALRVDRTGRSRRIFQLY